MWITKVVRVVEGGLFGLWERNGNSIGSCFAFNYRPHRRRPHLHPLGLAFSSLLCQLLPLWSANKGN